MRSIGVGLLLALSVPLAACVSPDRIERAQLAERARTALVGMPLERVAACMGAPHRAADVGDSEVWTYESGGGASVYTRGVGGTTSDLVYGGSISSVRARFCEVDLVFAGGTVSRVNYRGPSGRWLAENEQCGFAVEACVPQAAAD